MSFFVFNTDKADSHPANGGIPTNSSPDPSLEKRGGVVPLFLREGLRVSSIIHTGSWSGVPLPLTLFCIGVRYPDATGEDFLLQDWVRSCPQAARMSSPLLRLKVTVGQRG